MSKQNETAKAPVAPATPVATPAAKTPWTTDAVARVMAAEAQKNGGQVKKGSFAAKAQSDLAKQKSK